MAATLERLAARLNLDPSDSRLAEVVTEAEDLVGELLLAKGMEDLPPPPSIKARAVLEAASDLWYRGVAPGGVVNTAFGTNGEAFPIRLSRDPLATAEAILAQWLVPLGFA